MKFAVCQIWDARPGQSCFPRSLPSLASNTSRVTLQGQILGCKLDVNPSIYFCSLCPEGLRSVGSS